MRALIVGIVRLIKRDRSWSVDPEVSCSALLAMFSAVAVKAVRGSVRRIGFRRARGITLIGRRVSLRNKRYIRAGRSLVIEDNAEIQGLAKRGVTFGNHVWIGRSAMIRPSGYYSGKIGEGLLVGDRTTIGPFCYLGCSGFIQLGSHVMIGPRVSFYAENHNFADPNVPMQAQGVTHDTITVEDDCWIGSHALILAGVTIGRGSIVAGGSVVTRSVAPYSIVSGVPARVVRSRLEEGDAAAGARANTHPLAVPVEFQAQG